MKRTSRLALLGALLATVGCGAQPTSTADGLTGAGSTFVYDIMDKWGREYERREGGTLREQIGALLSDGA